ncbi:MAG: hypothetical protein OQK66_08600 [Prosthecochloris sp.]|uniref:Uncharacterized protein n=1 Tax=Prosthecochloris aestuarii (strain DSM 271 / SK 413) TaxID=290512 RepID=B4S902_PROA2|nr:MULTISPECIES: hypothetical protein [Prosthecochloris]ACF46539.1 conserved hypothetical protein [Prosthecochloris aestuarii DSM 271]MCW8799009.1 hypothetical protein [Prosthecochloris sp.]
MQQVFQYPMTYPGWWLDYYYIFTWTLSMAFLAAGWGIFFRYGKFSYGIDLGCLWKSLVLLVMTTISLGAPNYYNTVFVAEHGQEGDRVVLTEDSMIYIYRTGDSKSFRAGDIDSVYQEAVTFNPPPKVFIVAERGGVRDSVFVTRNFPGFDDILNGVSALSGVQVEGP